MPDSLSAAVETALGTRPQNTERTTPESPLGPTDNTVVKPRRRIDYHIWGSYLVLVMVALIELFSASLQEVKDGDIFNPILRHCWFLGGGLVLMLLLQATHYRYIFRCIPLYVVGCLCVMVYVVFGGSSDAINGAMRAINIFGIQVLPAEFMKLGVALGVAWILARFQDKKRKDVTWGGFFACLGLLGVCAALLFSQGLSNTIIVVAIGVTMMFVGGMGLKKFGVMLAILAVCGAAAVLYKTRSHEDPQVTERIARINELNHVEEDVTSGVGRGKVWNNRLLNHYRPNKWDEPFMLEHQQEQLSYIAQARGGISGAGVGRSIENARLPLAYSDYVYAIVIEELGLIGGVFVLFCYLWILGRSAKLTLLFKHTMPGVLVMGCAFVIVFQAIYHMAIVSGVIPVSGQPLPLISKGGISVLATSMAFGIMLSASRHAVRITDSKAEQRLEHEILPENAQGLNPVAQQNV